MFASFYVVTISFLVGVFWRSFFILDFAEIALFGVLAVTVFVILQVRSLVHGMYVVLAVFACLLGMVRLEFATQAYTQGQVYPDEQMYVGEGVVATEPDMRDGYTVLLVDTYHTESETRVRLRMKVPTYPAFQYGERVSCRGTLHIPTSFETETGRIFNYPGFLKKDGVHYELRNAQVQSLQVVEGSVVRGTLLDLKQVWLNSVSRLIPEPEASLAGGLIVGAKRSLGDAWLEAFRITGLIHIVVLSGYNLTLVANSIVRCTTRLPRAVGFGLGSLGVVCFALMVGGGATVVRASVMAIIGMFAVWVRRPYILMRALLLAGVGMVAWNPFVLAFDPGFQLSFIATMGLVLGVPIVLRFIQWVPSVWQFREIVGATLATQIAVLPLLMYQVGMVSLVAPLVNILVLPLVPFVMLLGFVAGVVGMFAEALALPVAWCAHALLAYMFTVVHLFTEVSFAAVLLPPISPWLVAGMYVVLGVLVWRAHQGVHKTAQ